MTQIAIDADDSTFSFFHGRQNTVDASTNAAHYVPLILYRDYVLQLKRVK